MQCITHALTAILVLQGAASLGSLALFSAPFFRRLSYEIFLRTHQALVGLSIYGIWRHLPNDTSFPRLYLHIALGILSLTSSLQLFLFLYRNGLLTGRQCPRAVVSYCHHRKTQAKDGDTDEPEDTDGIMKIRLILPRPVEVMAGQYINLWMPSISLWSWMQTHPFMITSWRPQRKQDTLGLLVQPGHGVSADLFRQVSAVGDGAVSFLALYSGPHGVSAPVGDYESILLVASELGIAAVIPYIKKIIYSYNTCTSQIRRIHLVWQIRSPGEQSSCQ